MAARLPAGLFLAGEDAVIADHLLRVAVRVLLSRDGTVPARVGELLEEVHRAALEFRVTLLVEPGSGTASDESGSVTGVSPVTDRLSTQQASRIANVSESYLRRLARRGVLKGMRGHGGGWELDAGAFAVWLAERERLKAA